MSDDYTVGSGLINLPGGSTPLFVLAVPTPARPRLRINRISVGFNGTNNAQAQILAQLVRVTNTPVGTTVAAAYGPNAIDPGAPTTCVTGNVLTPTNASPGVWSTAPIAGAILWEMPIPPVTTYPEWIPLGKEIVATPSSWFGVVLAATVATGAWTTVRWTE